MDSVHRSSMVEAVAKRPWHLIKNGAHRGRPVPWGNPRPALFAFPRDRKPGQFARLLHNILRAVRVKTGRHRREVVADSIPAKLSSTRKVSIVDMAGEAATEDKE